jgi:hypothetical protein
MATPAPPLDPNQYPTLVPSRWDILLDNIVNRFHMVLGGLCQASVIVYHYKTGRDLGPIVSSTVFAFYGFLLGHAGVYQFKPDPDVRTGK